MKAMRMLTVAAIAAVAMIAIDPPSADAASPFCKNGKIWDKRTRTCN